MVIPAMGLNVSILWHSVKDIVIFDFVAQS